jgi:arginase family enzyme
MNLQHYFDAVDFTKFSEDISYNWKYSLGANIEKNTLKVRESTLKNVEMAIVGMPFDTNDSETVFSEVPSKVRKELYQLAGLGKINIIDFGNLKQANSNKGNYLALRDVVDYLKELGIVTIVLGGSQDYSYGICQAYRNDKFFSLCVIDAFLDVKKSKESLGPKNYLSRVFSQQNNIFQFSLLAYQSHYVAKEYFAKTKGVEAHLRLGLLRKDISLAEPVFRNSDFLSFDLGALKHSEAPGELGLPNGLYNEEACQLAKYAGLSNRLNVLGLFGMNAKVENAEITIQLAAQLVWYFVEGFLQRCQKTPEGGDGFVINRVEIPELNTPLIFFKNVETNQWWIQVQSLNNEIIYVACSEKDYLEAANNEIPEFWLKYIQKIDGLLK